MCAKIITLCVFNLYLTLPEGRSEDRATRGSIRQGLVQIYQSRIKKLLSSGGCIPFAVAPPRGTIHSTFEEKFPGDMLLPAPLRKNDVSKDALVKILWEAVACLLRKTPVSSEMEALLQKEIPKRTAPEVAEYETVVRLFGKRPQKEKAPKRVPRPTTVLFYISHIFQLYEHGHILQSVYLT